MAGKTNQSTRDEMLRLTLQAKRSTSCIVVLPAEREYLDAVKVDEGRKQELRQYVERLMNRKF